MQLNIQIKLRIKRRHPKKINRNNKVEEIKKTRIRLKHFRKKMKLSHRAAAHLFANILPPQV